MQRTSHRTDFPSPTSNSIPLAHLLNEVNGWLQIKTKIDELPLDAFTLVLLLLQDEHGVVEQLLQLLIGVVDAQLLKAVFRKEQELIKKAVPR